MEAWLMSDTVQDPRDENRRIPNVNVSLEDLADLGVVAFHLDPVTMTKGTERNPSPVALIAKARGYKNMDEVKCSPDHLLDYDQKLNTFFTEHLHEDEEIRLIKEGRGYFGVRDRQDQWIRIAVGPGDLIILPAGIYHRFTLDRSNYIYAMRLFKDAPKWTPINRPCDENPFRIEYLQKQQKAKL
jgi:1,2-dihydroxy-3-keto-5-methylthiopentene dioxygenase